MQFLRELVHSSEALSPPAPPPERPTTPTATPPSPVAAPAVDKEADLRDENRLLREQLRELTLTAASVQKSATDSAAEAEYWKAEALKAVMAPPPTARPASPVISEETVALRKESETLRAQLDAVKQESATRLRDAQAVHAKDRAEIQKELEKTETEARYAKEENERLRKMSDELFSRIETLETQLHAATERLRVESTRGETARALDATVRKTFGLPNDETVELSAGASDEHGRRGVIYVTSSYVAFEVLPLLKLLSDARYKWHIKEIATLDRVPGLFGRGSALAMTLRDNTVHKFTGLFNRRDIVQAILKSAEKFRPIEIRLLRDGRDHLEAARQATVAAQFGLEKISAECPPPPSFTAYVRCPFLALFLNSSASGRVFGDAKKSPCGLWEICVNGNQVSLRSSYNGRYLCAERPLPLLPPKLSASREKAGSWEHFEMIFGPNAGLFALRSVHGQYIAAAADGTFSLLPVNGKPPTHTELLSFSTN